MNDFSTYFNNLKKDSDLIATIKEYAKKDGVPIISQEVAEFLKIIVQLKKPTNILELGTGYAYSTLSMVTDDTKIITVDSSINSYNFSKDIVKKSPLAKQIELIHSTAIDYLRGFSEEIKFDMLFADAVKKEYSTYLDLFLKLAAPSALVIFDNVLWKGSVASINGDSPKAAVLKEFNLKFLSDARINGTILPIGDGLAIGTIR